MNSNQAIPQLSQKQAVCSIPILREVLESCVTKTKAHGGGIYRYDPRSQRLWLIAYQGQPASWFVPLARGEAACGQIIDAELPWENIPDYGKRPGRVNLWRPGLYHSLFVIRVDGGADPVAVIFLEHGEKSWFNERNCFELLAEERKTVQILFDELYAKGVMPELDLLEGIFERAPVAIVAVEDGKVRSYNLQARNLFGWQASDIKGHHIRDLYFEGDKEAGIFQRMMDKNPPAIRNSLGRHKKGFSFPIRVTAYPLGGNSSVGFVERVGTTERFLYHCAQALSKSQKHEALSQVARFAGEDLELEHFHVYWWNERHQKFICKGLKGFESLPFGKKRIWHVFSPQVHGAIIRKLTNDNQPQRRPLLYQPLILEKKLKGFILAGGSEWLGARRIKNYRETFATLAIQLTGWMNHLQTRKELEDNQRWLLAFFAAGDTLSSNEDPADVMKKLCRHIRNALKAEWTAIYLRNRAGRIPMAACDGRKQWSKDWVSARSDGLTRKALEKGEPQIIRDVKKVRDQVNPDVLDQEISSCLAIPLKVGKVVTGVLWAMFRNPRGFSDTETKVITNYARQAAVIMEDAQENSLRNKVIKSMTRIESGTSLEEIMRFLLEGIMHAFPNFGVGCGLFNLIDGRLFHTTQDKTENFDEDSLNIFNIKERWLKHKIRQPNTFSRMSIQNNYALFFEIDDDNIGIIWLQDGAELYLQPYHQNILDVLFSHVSLAIRRVCTHDRENLSLNIALKVAQPSDWQNLGEALNYLCEVVGEHFPCCHVFLIAYTLTENTKSKEGRYSKPGIKTLNLADLPEITITPNPEITAFGRQGVYLLDKRIYMPLHVGKRNIGLLLLVFEDNKDYDPYEKNIFELVCNLITDALYNILQLDQTTRKLDAIQTIYDPHWLIPSLDLKDIAQGLVMQGLKALQTRDDGWFVIEVWMLDHDARCYRKIAKSNESTSLLESTIHIEGIDNRQGLIGKCIQTEQRVLVSNPELDPDFLRDHLLTASELVVPIKAGDAMGCLNIESERVDFFDEQLISIMEALAGQASITIQASNLARRLKDMGGLIGKQSVADWVEMMSRTWGHDIYREVGSARGKLGRLKKKIDMDNEEIKRLVSLLNDALDRLAQVPKHFPAGSTDLDIGEYLTNTLRNLWERNGFEIPYSLQINATALVYTSPYWIERLLQVVAENAQRAMSKGPHEKFHVSVSYQDKWCLVRMQDTGPGIPSELKKVLFKRDIARQDGAKGSGFGLMLARSIALAFGGDLYLEDCEGQGATFVLQLPVLNS